MTLFSCKKQSFNYPEGTVGSSKITVYPILELKGDRFVAVPIGGAYAEAGVDATVGGTAIDVKIGGQVNTGVAGLYMLSYTGTNADGFSASLLRTVVVYDTKPDAAAHDLSGSYARGANTSVWTKMAPGVYLVANPGGAAGAGNIKVMVINPTGFTFSMPKQTAVGGTWKSNSESFKPDGSGYSWAVENVGYGTQVRNFVKVN